jgi:hypothetical protein
MFGDSTSVTGKNSNDSLLSCLATLGNSRGVAARKCALLARTEVSNRLPFHVKPRM